MKGIKRFRAMGDGVALRLSETKTNRRRMLT